MGKARRRQQPTIVPGPIVQTGYLKHVYQHMARKKTTVKSGTNFCSGEVRIFRRLPQEEIPRGS